MLSSIGAAMSTFVLGSTLSGTMTSSPTSVFWLSGVRRLHLSFHVVFIYFSMLFIITYPFVLWF